MDNTCADPSAAERTELLLAYIADLEVEVDCLHKQREILLHEVHGVVRTILSLREGASTETTGAARILQEAERLADVLRDFHDAPILHPDQDRVTEFTLRPLAEQVFRWQQRLHSVSEIELKLALDADAIAWFPARFRYILDNLVSRCLADHDPSRLQGWIKIALHVAPDAYELGVEGNGSGGAVTENRRLVGQHYQQVASARGLGPNGGLPVVKVLVEQSGGRLQSEFRPGDGTSFVVTLPRYDIDDHLSPDCRTE